MFLRTSRIAQKRIPGNQKRRSDDCQSSDRSTACSLIRSIQNVVIAELTIRSVFDSLLYDSVHHVSKGGDSTCTGTSSHRPEKRGHQIIFHPVVCMSYAERKKEESEGGTSLRKRLRYRINRYEDVVIRTEKMCAPEHLESELQRICENAERKQRGAVWACLDAIQQTDLISTFRRTQFIIHKADDSEILMVRWIACPKPDPIVHHQVRAKAIVRDGDRILLIKDGEGLWRLPYTNIGKELFSTSIVNAVEKQTCGVTKSKFVKIVAVANRAQPGWSCSEITIGCILNPIGEIPYDHAGWFPDVEAIDKLTDSGTRTAIDVWFLKLALEDGTNNTAPSMLELHDVDEKTPMLLHANRQLFMQLLAKKP